MPICIECSYPVPQLYHRASGKNKKAAAAAPGSKPGSSSGSHTRSSSNPAAGAQQQQQQQQGGSHHHHQAGQGEGQQDAFRGGGEAKKAAKGGGDVRLMQCPRCKRFADKYVEHDFVVLFIDLVLVKPQVYRHLLFNRLATPTAGGGSGAFDPSITRLGTLLVLFDVYLTWSAIEALPQDRLAGRSPIPQLPILGQYLFYLVLCGLTTVTEHLVIRELAQLRWFRGSSAPLGPAGSGPLNASHQQFVGTAPGSPGMGSLGSSPKKGKQQQQQHGGGSGSSPTGVMSPPLGPSRPPSATAFYPPSQPPGGSGAGSPVYSSVPPLPLLPPAPPTPRKNAVSTALLVSSCMKLFPILMVVWTYEDGTGKLARGVSWAVALQNVEALRILLGCGYLSAAILVGLGWLASWLVSQLILMAAGLRPMY